MTITLRQKDLENDNKSLYLDIYENGKRKFEFLSLYLIPEINQETKERNEATLKRAQEIRAERILHPETIPEKGHLMVVPDIPDDDSPEVIDWIQTYMSLVDLAEPVPKLVQISKTKQVEILAGQVMVDNTQLAKLWDKDRKTVPKLLDAMEAVGIFSSQEVEDNRIYTLHCLSGWYVDAKFVSNAFALKRNNDSTAIIHVTSIFPIFPLPEKVSLGKVYPSYRIPSSTYSKQCRSIILPLSSFQTVWLSVV